ncbi:hypothetical protein EZV62_013293 [Acer yangbiense]|uniref:Disease resistance R13L4/SHOC-2-like LRR domain-containing protein n=1 Tax=Acer yangbiense TaxID=1000413 RepID=A0A5C7HYD2_9ROSI|nr:hypothetical protein EZV62_013293 [Acer yangbiense]
MDGNTLNINILRRIGWLTSLEFLSLRNCNMEGTFPDQGPLHLPTHSHQNLWSLDISKNFFRGNIPIQVGAYLPMLLTLNISKNDFDGCIPSSIGDMKELSTLDLSYNKLSGGIPEHLANSCIYLRYLVLSNNSLEGQIFSAATFNLLSLSRLQLDGNHFVGKIPECLSNSSYLEGLYLSDNHLSGRIPSWLGNMSKLVDLIMPNNHLEGPIPPEFCQLKSLEVLNLAQNNISGNLPSCFNPPQIQQVHVSRNKLRGQLKDAFFNSSSLVTLDLGYNRFNGRIPNWIGQLSNLSYLILTHNNLEGEVPHLLCHLKHLRLIDLSHNNLSGQIPPCLDMTALHGDYHVAFNTTSSTAGAPGASPMRKEETIEFTTKNISYSYQGRVLTYMSGVDLSCNKLTVLKGQNWVEGEKNSDCCQWEKVECNNTAGRVIKLDLSSARDQELGKWYLNASLFSSFEELEWLDFSYIRVIDFVENEANGRVRQVIKAVLEGKPSIPSSIGDMRSPESLDLSNNQLSGEIPEHLVEGCISLAFLVLSNNSLQGQIFSKNFSLPNLLRLQLDGNHYIGNIPNSLLNSSLLVGLYLSDNHPSGRIPSWLGNMSDLSDIIMPNNNFEGPIPVEFCQLEYLEVLDLSENIISGDFPSCLNSPYIQQVHLSRNKLQGQLKEAFYNSSYDLSYNHLDGLMVALRNGLAGFLN